MSGRYRLYENLLIEDLTHSVRPFELVLLTFDIPIEIRKLNLTFDLILLISREKKTKLT